MDFRPIRKNDETTVHLVVVGFGAMGRALALHAARIGHFANEATRGRRIRITVVDRDAKSGVDAFRAQYPKIDHICEFLFQEVDPASLDYLKTLDELCRNAAERKELVTYGVCFETGSIADDRENLRIGLELSRLAQDRPVQTLIYQSKRCGFGALFAHEAGVSTVGSRLHAFGMLEDIYTWDVLLHESEDRLARAMHEDYVDHRIIAGEPADNFKGWEQLEEHFKESNRHAADHISIKLRALGYHDSPPQRGGKPAKPFSRENIELLAQMEHLRWCAERWLDDWEYGPVTIREKKINQDLVSWDRLSPEEQKKDHEQINAIPEVLLKIKRRIYGEPNRKSQQTKRHNERTGTRPT